MIYNHLVGIGQFFWMLVTWSSLFTRIKICGLWKASPLDDA